MAPFQICKREGGGAFEHENSPHEDISSCLLEVFRVCDAMDVSVVIRVHLIGVSYETEEFSLMNRKIHGLVPECRAKPAQLFCNRVMSQSRNGLGHELVNHDPDASRRFSDDLLCELNGGIARELRVHVQQKPVVLYAACDVHFANILCLKLVEKDRDVESLVMRITFEIVNIQN